MKANRPAISSRLFYAVLFSVILTLGACHDDPKSKVSDDDVVRVERDLREILDSRELILLTENSSSSYYLYKGQAMGFDYELMKKFAEDMGVELKVKIIDDLNRMFEMLNYGEGDLIACNLTITGDRQGLVNFSTPLLESRQVLVQRKPDGWKTMSKRDLESVLVRKPLELAGKTVYVHEYSSFYQRLIHLQEEIGETIDIRLASGDIDSEQLIKMVADGLIDYTIADDNVALLNQTYYPNLDVHTSVSFPQKIAVAMRSNSDSLLVVFNDWLDQKNIRKRKAYLYDKYFRAVKDQRSRVTSEYSSLAGKQISPYDDLIREYSELLGWDWRMLAALIYQESRFNPDARSWAGAFGLMQMMPATASRFGIDTTQTGAENIKAGVKYLQFLESFWEEKVPDPEERRKFVLASYNVGPGHVLDAQRIAANLNLDTLVWDNHVADCMLLKTQPRYYHMEGVKHGYCRGEQPYEYVRNILANYRHFIQNIN